MFVYLSFSCIASLIASLYDGVSGCSVTPSSAAVVAGDDLSLTCTGVVGSWRLESDANSALVLYQPASLYQDGSIREERIERDGYLVNDSNPRQVILTIIETSTVQANYYYCVCTGSSSAFAFVSVLASEPTFSNAMEIIDGESVIFTCSVSFNGTANTSITIEDFSGNNRNTRNYDETSKGLHSFSLDYSVTANSNIYQEYFCNIKLTNDTSKTMIYSRKLNSSVHWLSVRNVQIIPVDKTQCLDEDQCSINQTIRCAAEGNPKPVTFQWLTSVNRSRFTMTETRGDQFTFNTTGKYAVQCIAFNQIIGTTYNSSSSIFTAQVVIERLYYPASVEQNTGTGTQIITPLIVGLVVGLGGSMITLTIIVLVVIFCKRKKSQQNKPEVYTTLDVQRSVPSGMPQQDIYTDLQTSSVDYELPNGHRVEAEQYETVIPPGL